MANKSTTKYSVPKGRWTKITTDEKTVSLFVRKGWMETTVSATVPAGTNKDTPINAIMTPSRSNEIIFGIPSGSSVYAWGVEDSEVDVDPSEA